MIHRGVGDAILSNALCAVLLEVSAFELGDFLGTKSRSQIRLDAPFDHISGRLLAPFQEIDILGEEFATCDVFDIGSRHLPGCNVGDELIANLLRFLPGGILCLESVNRPKALLFFSLLSVYGVTVGIEPVAVALEQ